MTKKIILFLVEGPTDEDALAVIFSKIVKEHGIRFEVLHTDITADEEMTIKYIDAKIEEVVNMYLDKNPFIQKDDILKIVQIIDTDGAFIPVGKVKQSENGKTEYFEEYIMAKNRDRLVRRNQSKRAIVFHLYRAEKIAGYPYEIYYFSRNLEHVLHNIEGELSSEEKEDLAFEIADMYCDDPDAFLAFLFEGDFHVEGNYIDSWKFIMETENSLKRYSNVACFFENLNIYPQK